MTIAGFIATATALFAKLKYPEARLEAEFLTADALDYSRAQLIIHKDRELSSPEKTRANRWLKQRLSGQPLAYLRGYQDFYGLRLSVNSHTLIPRPETELMVDSALDLITAHSVVIDIGTGSGAVILAIASQNKTAQLIGLDISKSALTVAKQNAKNLHLDNRINFLDSDLLSSILAKPELLGTAKQLIITANLPYVPTSQLQASSTALTSGLKFEPQTALDGGHDGLDYYRRLALELKKLRLQPLRAKAQLDIVVLMEIQPDQTKKMAKLFAKTSIKQDCSKLNRLVVAQV